MAFEYKMRIYIYAIWFPTSKKHYIGQTINLDKRMQDHLRSGSVICKALYKYDDWQISILHTVKGRDVANLIEIEEIRNFNSVAPNGYNLTRGGDGLSFWKGKQLSEEHKKRIGVGGRGKKHPEQSRKMKGRKRPDISKIMKENNPCSHSTQSEIRRLRTRLAKLETEE